MDSRPRAVNSRSGAPESSKRTVSPTCPTLSAFAAERVGNYTYEPIAVAQERPVIDFSPTGRLLSRAFFEDRPENVAPHLLGKLLVHYVGDEPLAGRIVEVEAYLGPHNDPPDPAAHSHRGPTPRNLVLFGHAGHAYVYSIYGRYYCMNVSCEPTGLAGCVLIRALEPVSGLRRMAHNRGLAWDGVPNDRFARQLTSGPSRLCQALGILRTRHNGLDVTDTESFLQIRDDGFRAAEVLVTPRIGIKEAIDLPLRFVLAGHPCVSGPKSLTGNRILLP